MNKALLICCALLLARSATAQDESGWLWRTVDKIFNDTSNSANPKLIGYPTLAYSPETNWEVGASLLYVYYAKRDIRNRLSELSAFTFITLERQYGLMLDHALYTDRSKWFFLGKIRFQQFPLLYYGIGNRAPSEAIAQVDGLSIILRERVLRQVKGSLYLGLELDYNQLSRVDFQVRNSEQFAPPIGSNGSTNIGAGIGLVYDNRHNVLNVREGFFGEMGFLHYDRGWGSDFSYNSYFVDLRYFYPTTKQQVVAAQIVGSLVRPQQDSEVPFNQLAMMGGESMMRGYYFGRFRDDVLLVAQTEYRFLPFPFSKRLGGAAFVSAGGVSRTVRQINLGDWKVAGGAGLRFLLFPGKDIFTRFDVAVTADGLGYYFFIGEAF